MTISFDEAQTFGKEEQKKKTNKKDLLWKVLVGKLSKVGKY